jgi:hypothetical protein
MKSFIKVKNIFLRILHKQVISSTEDKSLTPSTEQQNWNAYSELASLKKATFLFFLFCHSFKLPRCILIGNSAKTGGGGVYFDEMVHTNSSFLCASKLSSFTVRRPSTLANSEKSLIPLLFQIRRYWHLDYEAILSRIEQILSTGMMHDSSHQVAVSVHARRMMRPSLI